MRHSIAVAFSHPIPAEPSLRIASILDRSKSCESVTRVARPEMKVLKPTTKLAASQRRLLADEVGSRLASQKSIVHQSVVRLSWVAAHRGKSSQSDFKSDDERASA